MLALKSELLPHPRQKRRIVSAATRSQQMLGIGTGLIPKSVRRVGRGREDHLGDVGKPFAWIPERRALLRAELDAYYAKFYGLTRDELRYILDPADVYGDDYPTETFRGLKNNEIRQFSEYRTRRLVLEAWDRL